MEIRELIIVHRNHYIEESIGYIYKDIISYFIKIEDIVEYKSDHIYVDDSDIMDKIKDINETLGNKFKYPYNKYHCFYTYYINNDVKYSQDDLIFYGGIKYTDWLIKKVLE